MARTSYDGFSDNCKYSPSDDPDLPKSRLQGDAGPDHVRPNLKGQNSQREAPAGEVKRPNWTPGRGTRGHGQTHEDIND